MVVFVVEMDVRKNYEPFFFKSINKFNGFTKRELTSFFIILWGEKQKKEKEKNNIHNVKFRKTFFFCFFFFLGAGAGQGERFLAPLLEWVI
jgi:hypothetical protein